MLSNDSRQHNSNFVLHRSWPQLHELTSSHTTLATLQSISPKCVSLPSTHLLPIPTRFTSAVDSSFHNAPTPSPPALTTPANFYTPLSPHSICITPASAAPAPSF